MLTTIAHPIGAVLPDHLPAAHTDLQFYTPTLLTGGRLPHAWIDDEQRVSTFDVIARDQLTLFVRQSSRTAWHDAAADLPLRIESLSGLHQLWSMNAGSDDIDALLVRPDGHIAALLRLPAATPWALRAAMRTVHVADRARFQRPADPLDREDTPGNESMRAQVETMHETQ